MKFERYVQNLQEITELEIIPVDENIWMESLNLRWSHTDPADRVIVSTAMSLGLEIVTTDKKMKSFYKKVIWN